MNAFRRFLTSDDAATAVEYAVMIGLILMVCITAVASLGAGSGSMWGNNQAQLEAHGF